MAHALVCEAQLASEAFAAPAAVLQFASEAPAAVGLFVYCKYCFLLLDLPSFCKAPLAAFEEMSADFSVDSCTHLFAAENHMMACVAVCQSCAADQAGSDHVKRCVWCGFTKCAPSHSTWRMFSRNGEHI